MLSDVKTYAEEWLELDPDSRVQSIDLYAHYLTHTETPLPCGLGSFLREVQRSCPEAEPALCRQDGGWVPVLNGLRIKK